MKRHLPLPLILSIFAATFVAPLDVRADDDELEETDDLPVVQNRRYRTEYALNLGGAILPIDPFYKGYAAIGGLEWHMTDLWAAEGRFAYLKNFKSGLREDLEENFTIPPTRFAELKWYAQAGALFKPFYGKLSFLNGSLVYGEFYLSLHGVIAQFDGGRATEENQQGKGRRLGYGGAPGFGIRGYLNRYFSARFDFRTMILYSDSEVHVPLELTLSFTVTTRSDI